eukprot:GHVR01044313.1.p1 GENE.GHVR01044313.1~~GHVR01044313.1.p1  ORF type:complete len:157 (-),score=69.43 GHVR01044313.1:51-521(-)
MLFKCCLCNKDLKAKKVSKHLKKGCKDTHTHTQCEDIFVCSECNVIVTANDVHDHTCKLKKSTKRSRCNNESSHTTITHTHKRTHTEPSCVQLDKSVDSVVIDTGVTDVIPPRKKIKRIESNVDTHTYTHTHTHTQKQRQEVVRHLKKKKKTVDPT